MSSNDKIKICFVGMDNYPMLNAKFNNYYIGGESVQQTLLAKALVRYGYDVSMVVKDHGQEKLESIDGINIYRAYKDSEGFPIARFFHPRLTRIFECLSKADADIYYQSCAGMLTGVVALFCRMNNKKFIYRVASDSDCIPEQLLINNLRDKWLYQMGLRMANVVLAQTTKQRQLLIDNYRQDACVVNMLLEEPGQHNDSQKDYEVLWVNNIRKLKRPEIVIDLAERLPQVSFCMVGGPCGDQGYYNSVRSMANTCKNIEFKGFLPYSTVNNIIIKSKLIINTSEIEGFPNTFLQSWIRGLPVISFFDPDSVIHTNCLGYTAKTVDDMEDAIINLLNDTTMYQKISDSAYRYAIDNFGEKHVMQQYDDLLRNMSYE